MRRSEARREGEVMAIATRLVQGEELDPERGSSTSSDFEEGLRQKVVGQGEALRAIVDLYQVFCARLNPSRRPVGNHLFLGPTGSEKFTC